MAKVYQTESAREDLIEIGNYFARDRPEAADRWLDQIDALSRLLAEEPLLGQEWPELGAGVRFFVIGTYVIFYRPRPDGVLMLRVLHSRRNIPLAFDS
jgi:toxin ParE1/3/4